MNVDTGQFAALTAEAEALRAEVRVLQRVFSSALGRAYREAYDDGRADARGEIRASRADRRRRLTIVPPA
jgi:hypothetical protein